MKQRFLTGLILIALLTIALVMRNLSSYIFDIFIGLITVYSMFEMSKLLKKMGRYNYNYVCPIYFILSYIGLMLCFIFSNSLILLFGVQIALLALLFVGLYLFGIIFKKKSSNEIHFRRLSVGISYFSFNKALNTLINAVYPVVLFMLMIFINHIQDFNSLDSVNPGKLAMFLLLLIFLLPIFNDTFAYLTGSLIGGKKLCPKISPNKTVSGAVGGLVWSMICAVCLFLLLNSFSAYNAVFVERGIKIWHLVIVGFISGVVSQIGDLFESFLKRKAGVKDSGDIFPGHGGFLDRFDSHIFNVVVVFVYSLILIL